MTNTGKSESMVERVARAIALEHLDPETLAAVYPDLWFVAESYFDLARAAIDASGVEDLIRTATAFVEELRRMGYGETSERALPGSFDPFVEALERLN